MRGQGLGDEEGDRSNGRGTRETASDGRGALRAATLRIDYVTGASPRARMAARISFDGCFRR